MTFSVPLAELVSDGLVLLAVTVNGYVPGQYSPGMVVVGIFNELLPAPPITLPITIGLVEKEYCPLGNPDRVR